MFQFIFCQARINLREVYVWLARFHDLSAGRGAIEHRSVAQLGRLLRQEIPPSAEAWHDLGARMASAGLVGAAMAAWEFALTENPAHLATFQAMGDLYANLRVADRAEEAYRHAMALLEAPPEDGDARSDHPREQLQVRLARALTRAERFPEARAAYEALAAPDSHALTLSWLCEQTGDLEAARRWLERAVLREKTPGVARQLLEQLDQRIRSKNPTGP
jgi:tetratricopeptide (TPR) repeat protein